MAFGAAGAGAAASDALRELLVQRHAQALQDAQLQLQQQASERQAQQLALQREEFDATQAERKATRDRQGHIDRETTAAKLIPLLPRNAPLTEAQLALIQGTDIGAAQLDSQLPSTATMPSQTTGADGRPMLSGFTKRQTAGGTVLRETPEEELARGARDQRESAIRVVGDPKADFAQRRAAGVALGNENAATAEDPEETLRRQKELEDRRHSNDMAEIGARQTTTGAGGGLSPTMESNVINRLTTQWNTAVKPVAELDRQRKLMDAGMAAAKRGDRAQGAQAVLVTFQKILDPTSVVRESEYMRSAAGQSLENRIRGAVERLAAGGAGFTLPELEKFAALAREAVKAQSTGYIDAQKARIGRTADRYQIPRDLVFEDFTFGGDEPPPAAPDGETPEQRRKRLYDELSGAR